MWWNEHGLEAWSIAGIGLAVAAGLQHGPLGAWLAYAIGWTACALGAGPDVIDCSYYGM